MKILFAGTDEFARIPLEAICKEFEIVGVLTKAESKNKTRKKQVLIIKELAKDLGIKNIFQFESLKSEARKEIKKLSPDVLVCVSYGKIFGPKFLKLFDYKLNLHPSKLPKYRGPSPLESAILNEDSEIGISLQEIALKMDTGDIYKEDRIKIEENWNISDLIRESSKVGAKLLCKLLKDIENKKEIQKREQNENEASYSYLIKKEQYKIDWNFHGRKIQQMIKAYYPNAFSFLFDKKLLITEAKFVENLEMQKEKIEDYENGFVFGFDKELGIFVKTKDGVLLIKRLKLQNKKEMNFKEFLNGNKSIISSILK